MVGATQISRYAIRVIGVIVGERDMRGPAPCELARLSREPLCALGLAEPFDREHRIATDDEASIADGRTVAGERRRDERPHAVGHALETAERLARDDGA